MTKVRKKFDFPLTAEELEALIEFLNDNSHNYLEPKIGYEIEFMERNGFDPAFLYEWIEARVALFLYDQQESAEGVQPDPRAQDDEYARSVALQLRDHFRAKWNIPQLTDAEKVNWDTNPLPLKHFWTMRKPGPEGWSGALKFVELSDEQIDAAVQYMREHFPGIIEYGRAVSNLSEDQGYSDADMVGRAGIFERYIEESIAAICTINYDEMIAPKSDEQVRELVRSREVVGNG